MNWKKEFRERFVLKNLRAVTANNEPCIMGKASDAEAFIQTLLEKQKKEERLKIIGELSGIIEKGITHEVNVELIYARLQSYILSALKGKE